MRSSELRKKFLSFFQKRGHKIVPSSSLISSEPTPTVVFTTAGMQQFTSYLKGEKDPLKDFGTRHLASCQKCFRSDDIKEVGDDRHHTFFEMLGNWSIGQDPEKGYFKKGAIKYALEFLVGNLSLDRDRIWTTIFKGEESIPKDEDSERIWQKEGIPIERIRESGLKDNFWGPVGMTGPCGPSSEIHYDRGKEFGCGKPDCGPNCIHCERFIELWNLVFMEYLKTEDGQYKLLNQKNVDTGIGFERLVALLQGKSSAYETDLFWPVIQQLEKNSIQKYEKEKKEFRILADHIRAIVFLASEGIIPSSKKEEGRMTRGTTLRQLIKRALLRRKLIMHGRILDVPQESLIPLACKIIEIYKDTHPEVASKETDILTIIQKEEETSEKSRPKAIRDTVTEITKTGKFDGNIAFKVYNTYGLQFEEIKEIAKEIAEEKNIRISSFDKVYKDFKEAEKKHQDISRAGVEKKFGGIGKKATLEAKKLHTTTHLLHQALRETLGSHVKQMGSDINSQRLRFDFSHSKKMNEDEIKKVENLVNKKIREDLEVKKEEMPYDEALKSGALAFFKEKYPSIVSVYSVDKFSKEICAGPHVKRTSELGQFKIIKEESSAAGIRRIRAILK